MASKPKVTVTPEMVKTLADFAGTAIPQERLADVAAAVQGVLDTLHQVDYDRLRDVEPAYVQPLRFGAKEA